MLGDSPVTAFLATTNAARAAEFYGATLGLRVVSEDPFALVFEANGVELRIQKVEQLTPQPFTAFGWRVDDVSKAVRALVERGVTFARFPGVQQDTLGIWAAPSGARIAWFHDPDGNVLSLAQYGPPNAR